MLKTPKPGSPARESEGAKVANAHPAHQPGYQATERPDNGLFYWAEDSRLGRLISNGGEEEQARANASCHAQTGKPARPFL
jgi:hypothetical protein